MHVGIPHVVLVICGNEITVYVGMVVGVGCSQLFALV